MHLLLVSPLTEDVPEHPREEAGSSTSTEPEAKRAKRKGDGDELEFPIPDTERDEGAKTGCNLCVNTGTATKRTSSEP